ncbi:MAG: peroxiredoxin [Deltaproteobacteria bacterium]|nr:peroxiredoxin [Deltaproteobacteria bacterium]
MIKEGRKAPAFNLPSSTGDKLALKDLAGKYVIVYFYPRDNTPKARDAVVIGVSKDSIESHCKFADKYKLKFPLLSDPDTTMLEKYDAWGEKNLYGKKSMGIIRSTVLIGPDGKVIKHFPKVKVNGHVEAVIEALDDARTD